MRPIRQVEIDPYLRVAGNSFLLSLAKLGLVLVLM